MSDSEYFAQPLFEEERAVPEDGLGSDAFPEDFAGTYRPERNRIVIQYTDEQEPALRRLLGLMEIDALVFNFEDLGENGR